MGRHKGERLLREPLGVSRVFLGGAENHKGILGTKEKLVPILTIRILVPSGFHSQMAS